MGIDEAKVGKKIKAMRLDRNLTQEELAKKSGLSTNTVARLERGQHKISVDSAEKLAKALNVKASDILLF